MHTLREKRFAPLPGAAPVRGTIRREPEDFQVIEELGFTPDGRGEHLFLRVRKRGTNTEWVAGRLGRITGRGRKAVGYAGMKDRLAVTEQWFSLHWPWADQPDLEGLRDEAIELLSVQRHSRKLRRGALEGNRFQIRIRELTGDPLEVVEALERLAADGFPNYFGEQRFGRDRANVSAAQAWFTKGGGRPSAHRRGLLLSAARAWLFNLVLDQRVITGSWNRIVPGEVLCLAGNRSFFAVQGQETDLEDRLRGGDVSPSGPLWGRGENPASASCLELERSVVEAWPELKTGLEAAGLRQERRPLRCLPGDLRWSRTAEKDLELSFSLPAGSYATVLLQSALDVQEAPS